MKLATYRDGSREGQLVVVSRDLASAHFASGIVGRLGALLDDWNHLAPQLEDLSATLNDGKARHAFPFDPRLTQAPLARGGSGWLAAGEPMRLQPVDVSDAAGTGEPWRLPPPEAAATDLALAAGVVAWTGELAADSGRDTALESVRLLGLMAMPIAGHGPQPQPVEADTDAPARAWSEAQRRAWLLRARWHLAPVVVTPDELGEAWRAGRAEVALRLVCGGRKLALSTAGAAGRRREASFGTWLAAATEHHRLRTGCALAVAGHSPEPLPTPGPGESLQLEALAADGRSVFGLLTSEARARRGAGVGVEAAEPAEPSPVAADGEQAPTPADAS